MDLLNSLFAHLKAHENSEAFDILEALKLEGRSDAVRKTILLRSLEACFVADNFIAASAIVVKWQPSRLGRDIKGKKLDFWKKALIGAFSSFDDSTGFAILTFLELDTRTEEEQKEILILCLSACQQVQNEAGCRQLLENWEGRSVSEGQDVVDRTYREGNSMIQAELFLWNDVPQELLAFVLRCYREEIIPVELLTELIQLDTSENVYVAMEKVTSLMGEQLYDTYQQLEEMAFENENSVAVRWLQNHKDKIAPEAPIPDYVSDFGLREPPDVQIKEIVEVTDDELADLMTETLTINKDTDAEANKEQLLKQISEMDPDERRIQAEKLVLSREVLTLSEDVSLFRYFGPVNPAPSADFSSDNVCTRYGGCRMFLCNEFTPEVDDIDDYGADDWFTGNCDYCSRKIRQREFAVRIPIVSGGWKGCFCSWGCVEEATEDDDESQLIDRMIDIVEIQLEKIGIQNKNFS